MKTFFGFKERSTHFRQELLAGLATFATMAYVLVVNASILRDAGMDFGAVLVATICATACASLLMGLLANYPIAISCGMCMSAYVTYTLVLGQGKSWEICLGASAIVGVILCILTVCRVRQKLVTEFPTTLRHALVAGIGLFLVGVGLKHVGVIQQQYGHWITVGDLWTLETLLLVLEIALIAVLEFFKVRSAFIIAILVGWAAGLICGVTEFTGCIAMPPSLFPTLFKADFSLFFTWDFIGTTFSILLITLLDSNIAFVPLVKLAGFQKETGVIPRIRRALFPDAIGTLLGSMLGSAPLAMHMESAAGIKSGGRTGLVSCVVAVCFLACLFLYPLIVSIPHFAPAAVLIVLGCFMVKEVRSIPWKIGAEGIPAAVMILIMPLKLSIYDGLSWGFIVYALLHIVSGRIHNVHPFTWTLAVLFVVHKVVGCFI